MQLIFHTEYNSRKRHAVGLLLSNEPHNNNDNDNNADDDNNDDGDDIMDSLLKIRSLSQ